MRKPTPGFDEIAQKIARITSLRNQTVMEAFASLEFQHASLAEALTENLGGRQRAANWMCTNHRAFDGRSAYEALADGDEDTIWDEIFGNTVGESRVSPQKSGIAN